MRWESNFLPLKSKVESWTTSWKVERCLFLDLPTPMSQSSPASLAPFQLWSYLSLSLSQDLYSWCITNTVPNMLTSLWRQELCGKRALHVNFKVVVVIRKRILFLEDSKRGIQKSR
jgi:hypothetical protein